MNGSTSPAGCATRRSLIAYGVHEAGRREGLGIDVGEADPSFAAIDEFRLLLRL